MSETRRPEPPTREPTPEPTSEPPVLSRVDGGLACLTLNRPRALHALNTQMCELMTTALLAWREDPAVLAVLIDHAGERGFCAGGDIRSIAESGAGDGVAAVAFFAIEYRLNHLLFTYPKPVIAVMDGITMGGGVGISAPAAYRVATERTVYAMPETGIGLFPDVGGGWFLPRLPGEAGMWLALTGARLKSADCLLLGLATDCLASDRLPTFKAELGRRPAEIETVLAEFEADAGPPPLAASRAAIDRSFGAPSVEAILEALEADGSDWARTQLQVLSAKSPQAMKVSFRQLREGRAMTRFEDEMRVEFRLASRVVLRPDFREGVRAVIIDKDNAPRWTPARLEQVDAAMLDELFAPLPAAQEWRPLNGGVAGAAIGVEASR